MRGGNTSFGGEKRGRRRLVMSEMCRTWRERRRCLKASLITEGFNLHQIISQVGISGAQKSENLMDSALGIAR